MPDSPDDDAVPLCGSDDLVVVVDWDRKDAGLTGQLIAENVSGQACRLADKPGVTPLQPDGTPLEVKTIISWELKVPRYVILAPGRRATARVHWGSWCGPRPADRARVNWPGGWTVARVLGPVQPECSPGRPNNMTTSWFHLIEGPRERLPDWTKIHRHRSSHRAIAPLWQAPRSPGGLPGASALESSTAMPRLQPWDMDN